MRVVEIAAALGVSSTTVRRALRKLQGHEAARQNSDGNWIAIEVDFDAIARRTGTYGAGEIQRRRHEAEREGFCQRPKVDT